MLLNIEGENRVLRRMLRCRRNIERKLHNEHNLTPPDIRAIMSMRMRWAGQIALMTAIHVYYIAIRKLDGRHFLCE